MTRKSRQMAALQQMTGLGLQMAQAELAQLNSQAQALRQNLDDMAARRSARAEALPGATDTAFRAGADLRWQQWTDQRRAVINMELARVLAQIADSETRLRRAFGRDQAAQSLAKALHRDARDKALRQES